MRQITHTIAIALLLMVLALSGCTAPTPTIEGKYYSEVDPSAYLELRTGGSYVVNQEQSFSGEYTVDDDTIKLIYTFGSFVLIIDGDILIDADGDRWIKE